MPEPDPAMRVPDHVTGDVVVAVDVGGTKTAAAAVGADGRCGRIWTFPTPAAAGPAAVLDAIAEAVRTVATALGAVPRAVGVGTAGVVDVDRGVIISATSVLPGWTGTAVRE